MSIAPFMSVRGLGVSTPYSRRPDWVATTREFLISVRHRADRHFPRYGDVIEGAAGRTVSRD